MNRSSEDREALVELFFDLVRIPSPSGSERGVVAYLRRRLEALGLEVSEQEPPPGGEAGNLYCRLEAVADGIPVLFAAHTDTIVSADGAEPQPVIDSGIIRSAEPAVLGADDKAALAAIVDAVERIVRGQIPHAGIELFFTVSEENGLRGAKAADLGGIAARCGFCLDSTGPVGEVIVRSPSQKTLRALFRGKAAHAGVAPEEGRSAVQAAARAVAAMPLGRIDEETTANIGVIEGGEAVNVVPDRCRIAGECRSHDPRKLERQLERMVDVVNTAAAEMELDVELSVTDEFMGFHLDSDDLPVAIAADAMRQMGIEPRLTATGGGSDVNEFNLKGLESVNLSVGMERVHSPDEFIAVESLRRARDLVLAIAERARRE